jgi:hypothetical protein
VRQYRSAWQKTAQTASPAARVAARSAANRRHPVIARSARRAAPTSISAAGSRATTGSKPTTSRKRTPRARSCDPVAAQADRASRAEPSGRQIWAVPAAAAAAIAPHAPPRLRAGCETGSPCRRGGCGNIPCPAARRSRAPNATPRGLRRARRRAAEEMPGESRNSIPSGPATVRQSETPCDSGIARSAEFSVRRRTGGAGR